MTCLDSYPNSSLWIGLTCLFLFFNSTGLSQSPNPVGSVKDSDVSDFATTAAQAKQNNQPLPQLSAILPLARTHDAQLAQNRYVAELLKSSPIGGIKGAVVGIGGQTKLKLDGPLSAVLFRSGWLESSDRPEVIIRKDTSPGIETELGLILSAPITETLPSIEALKKKIKALVAVIELPAGKHDWPQPMTALDLIAANVDSDHYIVGPRMEDLTIDLDALPIQLHKDGQLINETDGGDAHRGQWWNFLHQINWAVSQGYELKPGHLVITGALGQIRRDGAGEYRATYGELGTIEFCLIKE